MTSSSYFLLTFGSAALFIVVLTLAIVIGGRCPGSVRTVLRFGGAALLGTFGFALVGALRGGDGEASPLGLQLLAAAILAIGFAVFWSLAMSAPSEEEPRAALPAQARAEQPAAPTLETAPRSATATTDESMPATEHTVKTAHDDATGDSETRDNEPLSDTGPADAATSTRITLSPEAREARQEIVHRVDTVDPGMTGMRDKVSRMMRAQPPQEIAEALEDVRFVEAAMIAHGATMQEMLDVLEQQRDSARLADPSQSQELARHNRALAEVAYMAGDFVKAEGALEELLQLNPEDMEAMNRKGHTCMERGDSSGAEQCYLALVDCATERQHRDYLAIGYGNLGTVYRQIGDHDRAERMHRKSLELEEENLNEQGAAIDYGNLGQLHQTRGELELAEECYRRALETNLRIDHQEGIATQYSNLGSLFLEKRDLDQAEIMFRHALIFEERLARTAGMADDYANLGIIALARGDLDEAEELLNRSLRLDERLGRAERQGLGYTSLGEIHARRGEAETAREMWTHALNLFAKIPLPDRVHQVQGWLLELNSKEDSVG